MVKGEAVVMDCNILLAEPGIETYLRESIEALQAVQAAAPVLTEMRQRLAQAIRAGNTVLLCGNGGSYAMAQHFAAELSVRFERNRPCFRAQTLGADGVALTAMSNDFSFEQVFSRSLTAIGKAGDILIAMSTSGTSCNVLRALERAQEMGITRLGFTGSRPTGFADYCDVTFCAPSLRTAFVQEAHLVGLHAICAGLDIEFSKLEPLALDFGQHCDV